MALCLLALDRGRIANRCGSGVAIDGTAPEASHGTNVDAGGQGIVTGQRLYQLIRQSGDITFKIEFLDPGVAAHAFTFG